MLNMGKLIGVEMNDDRIGCTKKEMNTRMMDVWPAVKSGGI